VIARWPLVADVGCRLGGNSARGDRAIVDRSSVGASVGAVPLKLAARH